MRKDNMMFDDDPLWYKDAIIYELHIKAFFDSNNNGIGDIRGLTEKLDYIQSLGVTAIWLLPFYPSPLKDDGYDISDYMGIHPEYGTLSDFKELLRLAHKRGIRIITELVLNHTSDQHVWFQRSRRAPKGSPERDYYVWSDTPEKYQDARIIFKDFESSNWTWDPVGEAYYWHRFYSHQPDLNYDNPRVQKEMFKVIDFWLDMGVDGVRLDAVPYLFEREGTNCENLPETHDFLKKLRAHVEKSYKNKMLLAEANQWAEDAVAYFGKGDECHMAFNFPVMPRMFMSIQMEDRYPIVDILDNNLPIPNTCQWALFLRNHDELTLEMVTDEERDYMYRMYANDPRTKLNMGIRRRLAPLLGNNRRKIELMNILLFSLPGSPVIYYGDEIRMGDNYYLGDRDGVRTPMQWNMDRNAGFSKVNPQKLFLPVIIDSEYHYESINVENQEKNLSSMLWWTRRVIATRKKYKAFARGDIAFLLPHNPKILAFTRSFEDETILVVINLSRYSQAAELDLSKFSGFTPQEVFSQNEFPVIKETGYVLTLGPYNHFWFKLVKKKENVLTEKDKMLQNLFVNTSIEEFFESKQKERIEQDILPDYLKKSRWFAGKGRVIRKITINERIPLLNAAAVNTFLTIINVQYYDGMIEDYVLPLSYVVGERMKIIKEQYPASVIAYFTLESQEGIIYDSSVDEEFHQLIFEMFLKRKKFRGENGEFAAVQGKKFKTLVSKLSFPLKSRIVVTQQSNSSIVYNNALILKLFRKFDFGKNPDAEVSKYLSETKSFSNTPMYYGAFEYKSQNSTVAVMGLLQEFVVNQEDAWTYTISNNEKYYSKLLSMKTEIKELPKPAGFFQAPLAQLEVSQTAGNEDKNYPDFAALLGKRTGEMHLALAGEINDLDFVSENYTLIYQKSIQQSMTGLVKRVFRLLEKNLSVFSDNVKLEAKFILESEKKIIAKLSKIAEKKISATKIRIHGDFHLGQVLFTGKDLMIIDFEGETQRPLSERRLKKSPIRDVTSMIRSFHYAAYAAMLKYPSVRSEDIVFLEPWAESWYYHVGNKFLESYIQTVGNASIIPKKNEDFKVLFETFLLEKSIYELGYEINNRPEWVIIPLRGIKNLIDK